MTSAQREELARLQRQRPDLIERTEGEDGPEFGVQPYDLGKISPDDAEGIEVALRLIRAVAPSSTPLTVSELCRYTLPVAERAADGAPDRALGFADIVRATEMPSGYIVERRAERTVRRLEAIAEGSCGCALDPIPYWEPADAPFLHKVGQRNVSDEDYVRVDLIDVRVDLIDVRCERCGATFEVTKTTDYDRWTYTFARIAAADDAPPA